MNDEFKELFEKNIQIVEYYGVKNQIAVWVEEMSELTKELCKWYRKYDEQHGDVTEKQYKSICEEIADVTVCLEQLKYSIRYMEDDLYKDMSKKINRQIKRIQEDFNE